MKRLVVLAAFAAALAVSACREQDATVPPPHTMTEAAVGRYCGMTIIEHTGPKGQILLRHGSEAIWFSSARDAFAFTMMPEEPKDIAAIYVSDMGAAPSWEEPGADNWIEARSATFVIGSRREGGMGGNETVPFSNRQAAERFAAENGGRVVRFEEVPSTYVLSSGAAPVASAQHGHGTGH